MQNKVVLITGGSAGIGRSIGVFLESKGMTVYGTSRDTSRYSNFTDFKLVDMDLRDVSTIQSAVDTIIEEEGRIDVLINNAGVGITGPLEEIPRAEMENHFAVNLFGQIEVIKAVLPHMRWNRSGLIINVTSIAGYMGLPFRSIYSASKASLEIISESLNMELKGFGVRVANLAPSEFATNIASGRYHAPVLEDSPYAEVYQNNLDLMNQHIKGGKDPHMVARKVYSIIKTKNPKIHYKVGGWLQLLSIGIKRILPDKLFEKLIMNHYKL